MCYRARHQQYSKYKGTITKGHARRRMSYDPQVLVFSGHPVRSDSLVGFRMHNAVMSERPAWLAGTQLVACRILMRRSIMTLIRWAGLPVFPSSNYKWELSASFVLKQFNTIFLWHLYIKYIDMYRKYIDINNKYSMNFYEFRCYFKVQDSFKNILIWKSI